MPTIFSHPDLVGAGVVAALLVGLWAFFFLKVIPMRLHERILAKEEKRSQDAMAKEETKARDASAKADTEIAALKDDNRRLTNIIFQLAGATQKTADILERRVQ